MYVIAIQNLYEILSQTKQFYTVVGNVPQFLYKVLVYTVFFYHYHNDSPLDWTFGIFFVKVPPRFLANSCMAGCRPQQQRIANTTASTRLVC